MAIHYILFFSWGIHILGAIFTSITNLIMHLKARSTTVYEHSEVMTNYIRGPTAPRNNVVREDPNIETCSGRVTIK